MNRTILTLFIMTLLSLVQVSNISNFIYENTVMDKNSVTLSTSGYDNSSIRTMESSGSVHIFTPNASTAVVEAEEVQVEIIVHNPTSMLEKLRPILIFSGAFIVAAILIILRYNTRYNRKD